MGVCGLLVLTVVVGIGVLVAVAVYLRWVTAPLGGAAAALTMIGVNVQQSRAVAPPQTDRTMIADTLDRLATYSNRVYRLLARP